MHRAVWGFEVVRVVIRAELHLVALAMRAVVIRRNGDRRDADKFGVACVAADVGPMAGGE
jgi:hypothetical protein